MSSMPHVVVKMFPVEPRNKKKNCQRRLHRLLWNQSVLRKEQFPLL